MYTCETAENSHLIMRPDVYSEIHKQYNFYEFSILSMEHMETYIEQITKNLKNVTKINFSIGFVMEDIESGNYHYFYAEKNSYIMEEMFQISCPDDVPAFVNFLRQLDIIDLMCRERPSTRYKLVHITNVLFDCLNLNFRFGDNDVELPDYISNKRCITALVKCPSIGTNLYRDKLCAFRALACHQTRSEKKKNIEKETRALFAKWIEKHGGNMETFEGISLNELPKFEEMFEINICAYDLKIDGNATVLYNSARFFNDTMHINMHGNHISYVNNFSIYAKKYGCIDCQKLFKTVYTLQRHRQACTKSRTIYPGGFYSSNKTVYTKLEDFGLKIATHQRCNSFFCTFDFESILEKTNKKIGEKTVITSTHLPISVAVSNSINEEVICYINESPRVLVKSLLAYCKTVQIEAKKRMMYKFSDVLYKLRLYADFLVSVFVSFFFMF